MIRKLTSMLAAVAVAMATLAPAAADARDRRGHGYHDRGYHGGYYDHRRRGYRHHDNDDAVAAGVIGLVLGLAIGSAASQPRYDRCYERCAPPPPPRRCYDSCDRRAYYDEGYYDPRYDDYGYERSQCLRRERRWDPYARRYVIIGVPC